MRPYKFNSDSTLASIGTLLAKRGEQLFHAERQPVEFAYHAGADQLINDLDLYPHAFVLGCVMDRQINSERAWIIPHRFRERLQGDFSMARLSTLSFQDVENLMSNPLPLHRFVTKMSGCFHSAIQRIATEYAGNAAAIWSDNPSSAEVISRFLAFDGVGPKIASMAVGILARNFKIPLRDYHYVDVAADVHVRRVFARLGLTSNDATVDEVIWKARTLNPGFPGIVDFPVWEIGHNWCRPKNPNCDACYMNQVCAN